MTAKLKMLEGGASSIEDKLEPLAALKFPDATPAAVADNPRLAWVKVADLRINRAYQRDLTPTSMRLIRTLVEKFDWARMKALSVLELGDGTYEVLDGQHTAIAAMSHGAIPRVPCLVSAQRKTSEAAAAFVDLNTQRLALSPMQIFWGEVAAGDEIACDVVRGVQLGGGKILRSQASSANWKYGDTIATGALKKLAAKGGVAYVKRVVALGVASKLRPINRDFVVAFEDLIWGRYAGKITDERIVDVVRIHGATKLQNDARRLQEDSKRGSLGNLLADVIRRLS